MRKVWKFFKIFVIFLFICNSQCGKSSRKLEIASISRPISETTFELFSRHKIDFDLILLGRVSPHLRNLLNGIRVESRIKIEVRKDLKCEEILNRVFVMLIEEIETLKKILEMKCFEMFDMINPAAMVLKFLIYVEKNFDETQLEVRKPNHLFGDFLHFSYFIVDTKFEVMLKTFEWWTSKACYETQFVTVNSFMKKSKKWKKNLEIPQKFKNFHNCTLNVHSAIVDFHVIKAAEIFGLPFTRRYHKIIAIRDAADQAISKIIGDQGNYSIKHMKHFETTKFHVQFYIEKFMPFNKHHVGSIIYDDTIMIMIPLPRYYTSYEKMMLPFDYETWCYLFSVFVIGLLIVFIINMMPRWFQDLIYGTDVRGAAFNMIGTFFGIGQIREPENFTGRILLLFFIFFCLIFRTAYQGVFFEMMTNNLTKPQPSTIEELNELNFTLYTLSEWGEKRHIFIASKIPEEYRPRIVECNFWDVALKFTWLSNPNRKIGITCDTIDYKTLGNGFKFKPQLLAEVIFTEAQGIRTHKNNFMYHHIEDVMPWLIQGGIPQHHVKFAIETAVFRVDPPPSEPQVFTMRDLDFGFVVWLVSCTSAVGAFIVEIFWEVIKRTFMGFAGLKGILRILSVKVFL